MSSSEEAILWREMMSGDENALGKLMHAYFKPLIHYGYKFVKNDDFIKDCIQDMFIDIWNARERIATPASVKAYLFVALKRKIERNITREPLIEDFSEDKHLHVVFSPEWWLIKEESVALRTKKIAEVLNSLPKRQREVVYLKFFEDMSREEIAGILSITPQTVSNLLQLAFAQMRKNWRLSTITLLLLQVVRAFLI